MTELTRDQLISNEEIRELTGLTQNRVNCLKRTQRKNNFPRPVMCSWEGKHIFLYDKAVVLAWFEANPQNPEQKRLRGEKVAQPQEIVERTKKRACSFDNAAALEFNRRELPNLDKVTMADIADKHDKRNQKKGGKTTVVHLKELNEYCAPREVPFW